MSNPEWASEQEKAEHFNAEIDAAWDEWKWNGDFWEQAGSDEESEGIDDEQIIE